MRFRGDWAVLVTALCGLTACGGSGTSARSAGDVPASEGSSSAGLHADLARFHSDRWRHRERDCDDGQTSCDGTCVDLSDDPQNCGQCGNQCDDDERCHHGRCAHRCRDHEKWCDGQCVSVMSDPDNCGDCGHSCGEDDVCRHGKCHERHEGCPDEETRCDHRCVDLSSDRDNCGDCGAVCGHDQRCVEGNCQLDCSECRKGGGKHCPEECRPCPQGQTRCGAVCVNTSTDVNNCGACGAVCPQEPGETVVCIAGACSDLCPVDQIECSEVCVDPATDVNNCGGCGNICPVPEGGAAQCASGVCGSACPTGTTECHGSCVDISTDVNNCGACDQACSMPVGGLPTCSGGNCGTSCPGTGRDCSGICVDTATDVNNCGACDHVCPTVDGQIPGCLLGSCTSTCSTGETACDDTCVDTQTDLNNCGTCDNVCPAPEGGAATCTGGSCGTVCPSGETDCSGVCANLSTNVDNCGSCGHVCAVPTDGAATCSGGNCGTSCPGSELLCGSACVDVATDVNNCGSCGHVCPAPSGAIAACSAGECGYGVTCTGDLSNIGTGDFTVEFRITLPPTATDHYAVVNQRRYCNFGMFWGARVGSGTLGVETEGTWFDYSVVASSSTLNDGLTHDVVLQRTNGTLSILFDGQAAGSGPSPASFGQLPPFEIGVDPCDYFDGTQPFAASGGTLTDVCVAPGAVPTGMHILRSATFNGHTYYLLSQGNWTDSEQFAEALGGHLVTIDDDAENTWVYQTFGEHPIWIGLYAPPGQGWNPAAYTWVSGSQSAYRDWWYGEPNFPDELWAGFFGADDPGGRGGFWNNWYDQDTFPGNPQSPMRGVVEIP